MFKAVNDTADKAQRGASSAVTISRTTPPMNIARNTQPGTSTTVHLSPTTPSTAAGKHIPCARSPTPSSWHSSSSEHHTKSPPHPAPQVGRNVIYSDTWLHRNNLHSGTPAGFFNLTFDETETQYSSPMDSQSERSC